MAAAAVAEATPAAVSAAEETPEAAFCRAPLFTVAVADALDAAEALRWTCGARPETAEV
jgi:hypothetical protein